MKQDRLWRFEAYDARKSCEWITLWGIEEDQLAAAVELRNELNRVNAPVLLRIVRDTGNLTKELNTYENDLDSTSQTTAEFLSEIHVRLGEDLKTKPPSE